MSKKRHKKTIFNPIWVKPKLVYKDHVKNIQPHIRFLVDQPKRLIVENTVIQIITTSRGVIEQGHADVAVMEFCGQKVYSNIDQGKKGNQGEYLTTFLTKDLKAFQDRKIRRKNDDLYDFTIRNMYPVEKTRKYSKNKRDRQARLELKAKQIVNIRLASLFD